MQASTTSRAPGPNGASGFLCKRHYEHYLLTQTLLSLVAQDQAQQLVEAHRARADITLNAIDDAVICTGADGCIDFLNDPLPPPSSPWATA